MMKAEYKNHVSFILLSSRISYDTIHNFILKVDLTAYVEKHEFCFDAVLDEHVTNDEVTPLMFG